MIPDFGFRHRLRRGRSHSIGDQEVCDWVNQVRNIDDVLTKTRVRLQAERNAARPTDR